MSYDNEQFVPSRHREDPPVARSGDTFPCGAPEPHPDHLFWIGPVNAYRCDGDTDTRHTRSGRRFSPAKRGEA